MFDFLKKLFFGPKRVQTTKSVEIYTWASCPYCWKAKSLLKRKGVGFQEHKIDGDDKARKRMSQRAQGRASVPQVFIENQHIGGCDDLHALEHSGELDLILRDGEDSLDAPS